MTFTSASTGMKFGVAGPARDDVEVDVVGDSRAGDTPEIPAEIEAPGLVDAIQRVHAGGGEAVDLERLVVGELGQVSDVAARRDHQVPGRVRVLVQERDGAVTGVHEQRRVGGERTGRLVAEDAARLARRPAGCTRGATAPRAASSWAVSTSHLALDGPLPPTLATRWATR